MELFNFRYICILIFIPLIFLFRQCNDNPSKPDQKFYPEELIILSAKVDHDSPELLTKAYLIRPDGSEKTLLLEGDYDFRWAKFSPTKEYIAIVGYMGMFGPPKIFIIDHEGNLVRLLTHNGVCPVWSPDGEKIIYNYVPAYATLVADLYIINSDGTEKTQLTDPDSANLAPFEWSNDGSQLLGQEMIFYDDTTRPYNMGEIVLFTPEGKVTEYLTNNDRPDPWASFSPSCDSVAIVSGVFRQRDIYILDLNTRDITNLTNNPDHYMNVIWSPDGKEIAYTKKFFEGFCHELGTDVFIINVNTGESRRLTYTVEDSIRVYTSVIDWR